MLANVTACQSMMLRLAEIEEEGKLLDQHASLAKAFTTVRMRETVAWAREVHGGNGIIVDNNIGRYSPTPRRSIPTRAPSRCRT
jgi:glutaryl-CoA dehydrogenase